MTINGAPGSAAEVRRAGLHPAVERRRDRRRREDDRPGALGRPELRAGVLPDPARHLHDDPRGRRRSTRCRSIAGRSSAPTASSSAPSGGPPTGDRRAGAADRGRDRAHGVRQGVQRDRSRASATRASTRTRSSDEIHQQQRSLPRRRADEAGVLVGSRRRADEGAGRRPRHLEHLHLGLRRRQPAARHRHASRSTSRRPGRPTASRSPTRRTAPAFPDIIVQSIYEARAYTTPAAGTSAKQNYLPAWSPDGTQARVHVAAATATPRSTS